MSRPKGSKNKKKEEVIKMKAKDLEIKSANEIIASDDAQVSVKIELKVTKDDILHLLLEKREKELDKVINEKVKSLIELNKRRAKIYKDIYQELAHPEYKEHTAKYYASAEREEPEDENYFLSNCYKWFLEKIVDSEGYGYNCYHITRLSEYSNPKIAVERSKVKRNYTMIYKLKDYSIPHTYKYTKVDWEGPYKREKDYYYTLLPMSSKEIKKLEKQINELNAIYQETEKVEKSSREAQYNRLILDKDRSIRNELTKALIAGVDVKTLLNA